MLKLPALSRKPARGAVVAGLLLALLAISSWRSLVNYPGIDFYQYWVVGHALKRGDIPSIYDHSSRAALGHEFLERALAEGSPRQKAAARFRSVIEPMATPFLFMTLSLFALDDYDASLGAFLTVSLVVLVAAVCVLGWVLRLSAVLCLLAAALFLYAFEPIQSDQRVGNVGELQLGMLALYAFLAAAPGNLRQLLAGVVLGAATLFKPNLIAVAPLLIASWALERRRRTLITQGCGVVIGVLTATAASTWFFASREPWSHWWTAVRGMRPMAIEAGNVSFVLAAERWLGIRPGPLPGIVLILATIIALWVRHRPPGRAAQPHPIVSDVPVVAAGCLVYMLSSPLVWLHYLILALPAVLYLLRARTTRLCLGLAAFTAMAVQPLDQLFEPSTAGRMLAVIAGMLTLHALMLIEIVSPSHEASTCTVVAVEEAAGAPVPIA